MNVGPQRPTKYKTLGDIPDELVHDYSIRDPNNKVYKTRRWFNFKKEQILYSQNDGVPSHMRTPVSRWTYRATVAATFIILGWNIYTFRKLYYK